MGSSSYAAVPDFYHSPTSIKHIEAVALAQTAKPLLELINSSSILPYPISLLFPSSTNNNEQTWLQLEAVFFACLRTNNDILASQCLNALVKRFGETNERILALKGLLEEAVPVTQSQKGLEYVLTQYKTTIEAEGSANIPIRKRQVGLLKSLGRTDEAITALVELVTITPIDAEAWAELADLYVSTDMYTQAVFALEEVLLLLPNAWNIHARLGEVLYMATFQKGISDTNKLAGLSHSIRRFCRSIELCDNYLRGFYGLALATKAFLPAFATSSFSVADGSSRQAIERAESAATEAELVTVQNATDLLGLSTRKLDHFIKDVEQQQEDGYSPSELEAARALYIELQQKSENALAHRNANLISSIYNRPSV